MSLGGFRTNLADLLRLRRATIAMSDLPALADIVTSIEDKRFALVLTERTDHLQLLLAKLQRLVPNVFVMKGGMGKKQREALALEISAVPKDQQRVIIATGRYTGEGFDDAPFDTLFLAMPISLRRTLQQYVGRFHRSQTIGPSL